MPNQYTVKKEESLPENKKRCAACGEVKELTEFYLQAGKHRSGKKRTDYRTQCKKCISSKNAEYQKFRRQQEKKELRELRELKNASNI